MTKMGAEILSEQTSGSVAFQTVDRAQRWDDQAIHHILKEHNISLKALKEFQNLRNDLRTTSEREKKATLLKRGREWIDRNQEFLGESATLVCEALGLRDAHNQSEAPRP